jgi:rhodanese-related sulfurtransferase
MLIIGIASVLLVTSRAFGTDPAFKLMLKLMYGSDIELIMPMQLKRFMENKIIYILDTRELEEYNVSHIRKARHVGYKKFSIGSIANIPRNDIIILYCSVGYRSQKIGRQLLKAGYKRVYNLYGGIFEWVNQGYPIYDISGKTKNIHGYSRSWSRWLKRGNIRY